MVTIPVPRGGIFVGVDGSAYANGALRWAVHEAAMRNVPISLVHGLPVAQGRWAGYGLSLAPLPADIGQWQEQQGQQILDDAARLVEQEVSDKPLVMHRIVFSSALVPTLTDLTKQAGMMVVGSRGQGALRRGLLGSVSTALVHHAHCPVAVIREDAAAAAPSSSPPVLVSIEGFACLGAGHRDRLRRGLPARCRPGGPVGKAWDSDPNRATPTESKCAESSQV